MLEGSPHLPRGDCGARACLSCDRSAANALCTGWVSMVAIGTAAEHSGATRLKDSLSLSRVGQPVAIGTAAERSGATKPNGLTSAATCGSGLAACAVGESVTLLHPSLPLVGVSTGTERESVGKMTVSRQRPLPPLTAAAGTTHGDCSCKP